MTKTIENYQAEVENDINERKVQEPPQFNNGLMIGMINVSNDRHKQLEEGTQLGFKLANFNKSNAYQNKEAQLSHAKKSYKHLIVGDIIVGFRNTNLDTIHGYACEGFAPIEDAKVKNKKKLQ